MKIFHLLAVLTISVITCPAKASYIYTYTGNNYSSTIAPYDNSMSISGWFHMESPIPPNIPRDDILDRDHIEPSSFSFFDGVTTLTENDVEFTNFTVATDDAGEITEWFLTFNSDMSAVGDSGTLMNIQYVIDGAIFDDTMQVICMRMADPPNEDKCPSTQSSGGEASIYNNPGTWSVSQIPLPPALWLFGSGLLGLVGIARRKKAG